MCVGGEEGYCETMLCCVLWLCSAGSAKVGLLCDILGETVSASGEGKETGDRCNGLCFERDGHYNGSLHVYVQIYAATDTCIYRHR